MRLLGIFLVKIGLGAAINHGVVGASVETGLKICVGKAAEVEHGGGISCSLLI